jgi:hypothetical protein
MRPEVIKTIGYVVSCASVALLGVAAYPGAEKAGLLPALFAGMATSVAGMGLRWLSYEIEKRRETAAAADAGSLVPGAVRQRS